MTHRSQDGLATVVATMALLLMSAFGAALVLNTSYDIIVAANMQRGQEGLYAATAAMERALVDIQSTADWNRILQGAVRSGFVDGPGDGVRRLADGESIDLGRVRNQANCRQADPCGPGSLAAVTASRPWGANNPVWVLYAHGPLAGLLPDGTINSSWYVLVMSADDPSENDDDPYRDGTDAANPGTGRLALRAEGFGPRGGHAVVEAVVSRAPANRLRVLSWRQIR
ncbi:MAG: pilus assembly PilX N-terminal domain-containing protein [Acidobacteriota bacterium]